MGDFPIEVIGFILFFLLSLISSYINKKREQQKEEAELAEAAARRSERHGESYEASAEEPYWLEEENEDFQTEDPLWGAESRLDAPPEIRQDLRESERLREHGVHLEAESRALREQAHLAATRLQQQASLGRDIQPEAMGDGDITQEEDSRFPVEMGGEIGDEGINIQEGESVRQSILQSLQSADSARKAFLLSEIFGPAMGIREQMGPRDRSWER